MSEGGGELSRGNYLSYEKFHFNESDEKLMILKYSNV